MWECLIQLHQWSERIFVREDIRQKGSLSFHFWTQIFLMFIMTPFSPPLFLWDLLFHFSVSCLLFFFFFSSFSTPFRQQKRKFLFLKENKSNIPPRRYRSSRKAVESNIIPWQILFWYYLRGAGTNKRPSILNY